MKVSDAVAILKGARGANALLAYALHVRAEASLVTSPDAALALCINDTPPGAAYVSAFALGAHGYAATRKEKKVCKKTKNGIAKVAVGNMAAGVGLFQHLLHGLTLWDVESVESLAIVKITDDGAETVMMKII
jgi:hypothetical protein